MSEINSTAVQPILVSYIIPSYNHAQFIAQTLESIAKDILQSNFPSEILIIDDGSKDNSVAIIQAWAEQNRELINIRTWTQENQGVCATLNRLVERAVGKYLRVCGSDDIIIAGSTQTFVDRLVSEPGLVCIVGDAQIINEQGVTIHDSSIHFHGASIQRLTNKNTLAKELIQHWCIAGPTSLINKDYYQKVQYDPTLVQEDFDMFLSLLSEPNALAVISTPVALYRLHSSNASKTNDVKKRMINIRSFLKTIDKHISRKQLTEYLIPLKYKTKAKLNYLEKKYSLCFLNMMLSFLLRFKVSIKSSF